MSEWSVEQVARVCHEVNRAYCRAIDDDSQLEWEDAPDWQRDSTIAGVEAAVLWPNPRQQHDAWMGYKLREGWRYGAVKDAEAKTHPCLLPWDDLPREQRTKDELFIAVVEGFFSTES